MVLVKIQHPAKWIAELAEPSHIIIIDLLIALAGAIWSYRRQPLVTVLHDPPSAEDIAKTAAPIQQKLNIATNQRDDALAEVAALKRQIENPPNARSQLAPPNPVEYRRLSRDQMNLRESLQKAIEHQIRRVNQGPICRLDLCNFKEHHHIAACDEGVWCRGVDSAVS